MQFLATFLLVLTAATCGLASERRLGTIIFSTVVHRHGDRSPTSSYPNDPYNNVARYWPRGYGQLSEIGETQHYLLGSYLRQRYSHLLPAVYNVNDTYVRSTDVDRTLMSALSNLAGLYPHTQATQARTPLKFQAIPVNTESSTYDTLLQPTSSCTKYTTLKTYLKSSYEYQCVMNETAEVQEKVTYLAGYSTFSAVIYDTLFIEELYGLRLPKWVREFYPNPLKNLYLFEAFITAAGTTELQRLSAGPMLKEIIENMESKVAGTLSPNRKLYVYSAHDGNVVDTLQALKVFNGILVPYASAILFELRVLRRNYYVTVSYKNSTSTDPYLLQLPGCDSLCPLDQFIALTKEVVPEDFDSECAEEVEAGTEYNFQIPAAAILPEWRHCFKKPKSDDGMYHYISFTAPFRK